MVRSNLLSFNAMKIIKLILIFLFFGIYVNAQEQSFEKENESRDWVLQFTDSCTGKWQNNWFLDGQIAKVENREKGMNFSAGPVNRNDAHHAVLWTRESFTGDVKLEYYYTRTDTQIVNVNILYIQATGIGEGPYDKNISLWNDLRKVPSMSIYYNYMNTLQISYSDFKVYVK